MKNCQLYRYCIPVDSKLILRERFLKQRQGLLVQLQQGEKTGWGEIAPLPEFSTETLETAEKMTALWLQIWQQNGPLPVWDSLPPSVAFGLSCALAELNGQLQPEGNFHIVPLCHGDPDELYAKLNGMNGEKIAKVKIGMYEANRDGMIVDMLLEAIPDLQLRLDANRRWTLEKARQFAKYVKPEHRRRIQFLEEPCKTQAESSQFAAESGIALAWDESVRAADFRLEKEPHLAAVVIKPTLIGSLARCIGLIKHAQSLGITAVISSSLESSFGLTRLARLAAQYTPTVIPGLDTLDLMDYQVVCPWQGATLPLVGLDSEFITRLI